MELKRNILEITDFQDQRLDVYARLNENQLLNRANPSEGLFIAESPKVIERALKASYEPVSMLVEKKHITGEAKELIELLPDIPIFTAEFSVLKELTGFELTRGALCAMQRKPLPSYLDIVKNTRRIAILEDVVNPTNVGAIFRSAAALHMDAILLTPNCSNPLYRRSLRVSMGTVFQIPWTYIGSKEKHWIDEDLSQLKNIGFKTVAMALHDDSYTINDEALQKEEKLAIILGTEGDGLCSKTIATCDYTVKIPMSHDVDSLNVAAASAVAFWELGKINHD